MRSASLAVLFGDWVIEKIKTGHHHFILAGGL